MMHKCEYRTFADELKRDQFIAGVVSEPLLVKLIGKRHRHREGSQTKVTLREVVETAKAFETTTISNELMKSAEVLPSRPKRRTTTNVKGTLSLVKG